MLHNPSLNERSECRLGGVDSSELTDTVPRRGTMREARNDEVYASKMHSESPRLAISALHSSTNPPVCARFARLDWGYEAFSLFEAGR